MKFPLLVLSFISLAFLAQAQGVSDAYDTYSELKEGILLVRLEDYYNAIEKYADIGYDEKVRELEALSSRESELIKENFSTDYKFGKYAFFYAKDIDLVLERQPVDFFDANGKIVQINDSTPRFICKKEILNYTAGSFNKYYHIYGIKNEALFKIPEPFRTDYRIPLFVRIFDKDKYQNEVEYLNTELYKEYGKLARKLNK